MDRVFDFLIGRKHSRKVRQVKVSFGELQAQIYWPTTDQKIDVRIPTGHFDTSRARIFVTLERSKYMEYLVNLTLKSEEITANFSGESVGNWDSHFEFMKNDYFTSGGSVVRLNPESEIEFEDSPLSGTAVDNSENPPLLDEVGDGFEFILSKTLDDRSVGITYQLCPQIEVSVEAGSEEEAKNLCQSQGFELFDIIDVAADEVVGTLSIQVNGVREA